MRRWIRGSLFSLLTLLCLTMGALAEEYDGYIIRLEPQVNLLSEGAALPEGVEEVYGPENLYKTADEDLIAQLEEVGLLLYAEPNYPVDLLEVPDDPNWLNGNQWDLKAVGMPHVWERNVDGQTAEGTRIRVGIIDSGLYASHEDLQDAHIVPGVNLLAEEGTEERNDTSDAVGHGTFITGTIAAAANNGLGIAGMAPEAEIMPLKCFDSRSGTVADVVKGIHAGLNAGCQVLNMSFGVRSSQASQALAEAVAAAAAQDVIMVAAVGNTSYGSTGNDAPLYPAAYDGVIGVGSVGAEKLISDFSYQNNTVDVVAPGENLRSLLRTTGGYTTGSGTSYATAEVTAAAALALSADPDLTAEGFMALLQESSEDLGAAGYDTVYGYGLLKLDRMLALLLGGFYAADSEEGTVAVVCASGLTPGSQTSAVQVIYDAAGALEAFLLTTLTVAEDGTLREQLVLPESGRVSLMLLDGDWLPLVGRWREHFEAAEPDEPAEELPEGGGSEEGPSESGGTTDSTE